MGIANAVWVRTITYGKGMVMITSFSSKLSSCNSYSMLTSQLFPLSDGQQLTEETETVREPCRPFMWNRLSEDDAFQSTQRSDPQADFKKSSLFPLRCYKKHILQRTGTIQWIHTVYPRSHNMPGSRQPSCCKVATSSSWTITSFFCPSPWICTHLSVE